jgi:hypothetical protein
MKKIEGKMVESVKAKRSRNLGNTKVTAMPDGVAVTYHDSVIAVVTDDAIVVNDCGWRTQTTKSRINAVLQGLAGHNIRVFQNRGVWHLYRDGEITTWDGTHRHRRK